VDPLTILLCAVWIEASWQICLYRRNLYRLACGFPLDRDSISGRNLFWVSMMHC